MSLQINSSYANPRTDYAQAGQERARGKEKCTTDTGQVDREIKQLREKKKQLEQQLAQIISIFAFHRNKRPEFIKTS